VDLKVCFSLRASLFLPLNWLLWSEAQGAKRLSAATYQRVWKEKHLADRCAYGFCLRLVDGANEREEL
jgi:hypothetical protein